MACAPALVDTGTRTWRTGCPAPGHLGRMFPLAVPVIYEASLKHTWMSIAYFFVGPFGSLE